MKQFEHPECEIIKLTNTDVIRTSENGEIGGGGVCTGIGME